MSQPVEVKIPKPQAKLILQLQQDIEDFKNKLNLVITTILLGADMEELGQKSNIEIRHEKDGTVTVLLVERQSKSLEIAK